MKSLELLIAAGVSMGVSNTALNIQNKAMIRFLNTF